MISTASPINTPRSSAVPGAGDEIKNPLSTIRLNMELLAEDFRGSECRATAGP